MEPPKVTWDDLQKFHDVHFQPAETEGSGDQEVDNLGNYNDGTQRTLTDDQIAIFRHSEIQQLIKAFNSGKEAAPEAAPVETKKKKQKKRQRGPINGKRHDVEEFTEQGEGRTFRRIARELDEVKQDDVELDY